MSTSLLDHFASLEDPRVERNQRHALLDIVLLTVCAVVSGAPGWEAIEEFGQAKLDWLRKFGRFDNGVPSHDCIAGVISRLTPKGFGECFRSWTRAVATATGGEVIAVDGKSARGSRDRRRGRSALHMVSAWACRNRLVLGQEATEEKSNEITAIPKLLELLDLQGCIVTIDAMGTQPNIAKAIRDRGANYILSVKDNQPTLADSVQDFFVAFESAPDKTPHQFDEVIEKDHGRLEVRRCYAFDQIDCLHAPERWPHLKSFAVIASERTIKDKTTLEYRLYISSLPANAARLNHAVRQHWRVENSLHWCMDVVFGDDQMRARTGHAAHNFAVLRHIALNLLRLAPAKRKGGLKVRRLIAATSDNYRAQILGLV